MKIALYIEDGLEQVVLTPEGQAEKDILSRIHDGSREIQLHRGSFYECRGGWIRSGSDDTSTMIVMRPKPAAAPSEGHPDD